MPEESNEHGLPSDEEIETRLRKVLGDLGEPELELSDDHVEAKTKELLDNTKTPGFDDDFNKRFDDLHAKASQVKDTRDAQAAQVKKTEKQTDDGSRGLSVGLTVAYTILGLPLLGAGIGWFIGAVAMQIGILVGAVVGLAMAVTIVNKANIQN